MSEVNPTLQRFVRIPSDTGGRRDRTAHAVAIEHGFRVVRWRIEPAQDRLSRS